MSDGGEIHQMSMVVGGLKQAVENMTNLWQSQERVATEGRRQMHLKIDTLKDEVRDLAGRVDQMSTDIAVIKPSVAGFNADKLRDEGAKRLGKLLIAGLAAAASIVGWAAHELIGYLFKH